MSWGHCSKCEARLGYHLVPCLLFWECPHPRVLLGYTEWFVVWYLNMVEIWKLNWKESFLEPNIHWRNFKPSNLTSSEFTDSETTCLICNHYPHFISLVPITWTLLLHQIMSTTSWCFWWVNKYRSLVLMSGCLQLQMTMMYKVRSQTLYAHKSHWMKHLQLCQMHPLSPWYILVQLMGLGGLILEGWRFITTLLSLWWFIWS
jgi:hypothetical protein